MERNPRYLIEKYPDLAGSQPVEKAVRRRVEQGKKGPTTKEDRVDAYLARLEKIAKRKSSEDRGDHAFTEATPQTKELPERDARYLKDMILEAYVLDTSDDATVEAIARKLYASEKQIAIEQGRGKEVEQLERTRDVVDRYKALIQEKADIQKKTLLEWLNYLEQNDAMYPMRFQYLVVRELGKM